MLLGATTTAPHRARNSVISPAARSMTYLIFVLFFACPLIGCASVAGADSASATYRSDVSEVCRRAKIEGSSAPDRTRAAGVDELRLWDDREKERLAEYLSALEHVPPPPDLEPEATEFVSAFRTFVRQRGEYLDASREGSPEEVEKTFLSTNDSADRISALASRLDISDCSTPGPAFVAIGWQRVP